MKARAVANDSYNPDMLVFCTSFPNGPGGAIHGFRLDPNNGRLTAVHCTGDIENPFFLTLSPCGSVLYSVHAPGTFSGPDYSQIAAYRLEGPDGVPRLLKRQSTHGSGACYLSIAATGKTILSANYSSSSVASFPLGDDGSPGAAVSVIGQAHSSNDLDREQRSHPHCIVSSADGRYVIIADLGLDLVQSRPFDSATHRLASPDSPGIALQPGSGPRHLVFSTDGGRLYVVNELSSTITMLDFDKQTGLMRERLTCSTLPDGFDGENAAADIVLTTDGRFMYACNRGHDSIAAYCFGDDGVPGCVEITSSCGASPHSLAISPCGSFLLCANSDDGCIVVFRIDSVSGELSMIGQPTAVPFPSCLAIR